MKTFKLLVHSKGFSEDDVVIDPKEFPDIKIGDILEIYHPDENNSHLLVQVKSFKTTLQQKDIISVDQGIASLFKLRAYMPVRVEKVDPSEVALDLVELVFKEQYISRSDMWKLRANLLNSSIRFHQNIKALGIRAQVQDLWADGVKVTCGVISSDTRVIFRSSTAMVIIFIQMSSEMWEFDTCGDLYMEKAVNGFLTDLFEKWSDKNICHEVSIILFSRKYYHVQGIEDIPTAAQRRMHTDYTGKIYEDFYRVVAQNIRSDDWRPFLTTVKRVVQSYERDIEQHINKVPGMPKGHTSKSSQGNVLEAINMAMNVFDNHYINRNFDRTGQLVILITPGAGVFEADRTLYGITKQRMVDYGVGSDMVCLAEQPPHAVPLIIFQDAIGKDVSYTEKYSIVHWLNYSFYFSRSQKRMLESSKSTFIPRMRIPERKIPEEEDSLPSLPRLQTPHPVILYKQQTGLDDVDEDEIYREYDRKIFQLPEKPKKVVNNPFSPSSLKVKLTTDRRRWTHAFPHGPHGEVIQTHHQISGSLYVTPSSDSDMIDAYVSPSSSGSSLHNMSSDNLTESETNLLSPIVADSKKRVGCAWGITGEQAWSPFLQTGVDWKSLTTTACFPVTTDFFPDNSSLELEYSEAPHTMDIPTSDRNILREIFQELIAQRLIQDFQLVIIPGEELSNLGQRGSSNLPLVTDASKNEFVMSCGNTFHKLTLNEELRNITVVIYVRRREEPEPRDKLSYYYSLWALDMSEYQLVQNRIYHKSLEDDWNYRDNYICRECSQIRDEDFIFNQKLKFWSSRYLLLPACTSTIKKLQEEDYGGPFDVFQLRDQNAQQLLITAFFKFAEILNKKKAPSKQKLSMETPAAQRKMSRSSGNATPTATQPPQAPTASTIQTVLSNLSFAQKDDSQGSPSVPQTPVPDKLTRKSPLQNIATAMKAENTGVTFLSAEQRNLPPYTFLSHDAVQWVQDNVDTNLSFRQAISILNVMLESKYIQGVFKTAETSKEILYGYYLYYFPPPEGSAGKTKATSAVPGDYLDPWFEAACIPPQKTATLDNVQWPKWKVMEFEVGNSPLSERFWRCQLGFQEFYDPNQAFNIELQWVMSTPLALNEMILNWARRVFPFGLHLIPAIVDPFGSQEDIADPMRKAIFIPVDIPPWISDSQEIVRIQRAILTRFGFIPNNTIGSSPAAYQYSSESSENEMKEKFIHVTGHAFVSLFKGRSDKGIQQPSSNVCVCKHDHEPEAKERRRAPSKEDSEDEIGFLWVRNCLLSKRWKLQATGDERLHDALLSDFRRFCANERCRLEDAIQNMATESVEEEVEMEDIQEEVKDDGQDEDGNQM